MKGLESQLTVVQEDEHDLLAFAEEEAEHDLLAFPDNFTDWQLDSMEGSSKEKAPDEKEKEKEKVQSI